MFIMQGKLQHDETTNRLLIPDILFLIHTIQFKLRTIMKIWVAEGTENPFQKLNLKNTRKYPVVVSMLNLVNVLKWKTNSLTFAC